MNIQLIEQALLTGLWSRKPQDISEQPVVQLVDDVINGRFHDVLTSTSSRELFQVSSSNVNNQPFDTWFDFPHLSEDNGVGELLRLTIAVALLHAFAQANWTGPNLDVKITNILQIPPNSPSPLSEEFLDQKAISELAYGGEPAYHLTQSPTFLRLAQLLLALPYFQCQSATWWRLRIYIIHQQVLDEPVAVPSNILESVIPLTSTIAEDPGHAGRLYVECGLLEHQLSRDKQAADYFIRAARATGLEYELTGALGKRTKFQQKDLSQLVLLAESHLADPDNPGGPFGSSTVSTQVTPTVPGTLPLNNDTLLEQTQFTSSNPAGEGSRLRHLDPSSQPPLHPLDQCILLSLCLNVKKTSPAHGLTSEQMSPYVERVISHPRSWSVHTMALLLRSRLEASRTRTVERATLQLQALIDQMPTTDSSVTERLLYFHDILLPSKWQLEKELGLQFMKLGVVKSALEIFERLEMWEEVVKCWGAMERSDNAIAIVKDLLEGRKSEAETVISRGKALTAERRFILDSAREAKLWCLLGDLEPVNAVDHYEHAWNISKQTSGRAMRSLGGYYFSRGEYSKSITCLKRAVAINPLLPRSWFILGCACVREEQWEDAKNAFSRCIAIDDEDGESWSNLASVYLRMGSAIHKPGDDTGSKSEDDAEVGEGQNAKGVPFSNKVLAFQALKQGLRHSHDNWRMWSNYMIVAMDIGELSEACRALGRIVEETSVKVGAQAVDEDVLERLVDAVTRATASSGQAAEVNNAETTVHNPNEGHGLYRNVSNLFERVLLPRVSSKRIFHAYARLLTWKSRWEEALKAYLDGYRCGKAGTFDKNETDVRKWHEGIIEVEEIVDVLRNFGPRVEGFNWRLQARSIVRTFIGRTRVFEDEPEWARLTNLHQELRNEH